MIRTKYILVILLVLSTGRALSQQETPVTQYWDNMQLFNPAYTGSQGTNLNAVIRNQWTNIQGAPESQLLSFGTDLGKNVGLGLSLMRDKTFIEKQTFFSIDFSYRVKLSETTDLFLGIKAGGNTYNINASELKTYNVIQDGSLENISSFTPNIGGGMLLRGTKWYFSLSVPRMLNTERARNEDGFATVATDRPHFYISTGYSFDLSQQGNWVLEPSMLLRYVDGAPVSMDLNTMVRLKDKIGAGMSYRTDQAYALIASLRLAKRFELGYAYEMSTRSELARAKATHEFMLSFSFQ